MVDQPYAYQRRELTEPDWRRFPGWAGVTAAQWESAQWQRAHCVKNVRQLRGVYGDLLDESFYADVEADQAGRATMSLLLPPPPPATTTTITASTTRPATTAPPMRSVRLRFADLAAACSASRRSRRRRSFSS